MADRDTPPETDLSDTNVFRLDRPRIRASFDRASERYESAAILQSQVADELLGRLQPFAFKPSVVLDLGAGTGRGSGALKRRYRSALVIAMDIAPGMLREAKRHMQLFRRFERVCGDALQVPMRDASVDVVYSNLMLQWCEPLDRVLEEIRRVLKPDGFFAFSTFGPDTLRELRTAWSAADSYNHVNHFTDMHDIGDALVRAGLREPVLDVERMQLTYPDTLALMRDLKTIGAHNVTAGRARGLTGRRRIAKMQQAYESFRRDGVLPATYEIVYGASWGTSGQRVSSMNRGEAVVPIGAITRRSRS
ncbi:MAG TPA: malonyl-ACP O-methyltransferase BioC [Steroidobacteraceae bacterium]|nr:malonyl-ACP O-methyltransferase BioC [Steroidobacteraceae bacterium]